MDFKISDKMKATLDLIEDFMQKEVFPIEPEFFHKPFQDLLPLLQEKRGKVKQMGLWGPNFPKELGGMGLGLLEHGLISESLADRRWATSFLAPRHRMQETSKFFICLEPRSKRNCI